MFSDTFFEGIGFVKVAKDTFTKVININRMQVGPKMFVQLERTLKLKRYKRNKVLGMEIEYYVDNKLNKSGYWHTEQDFLTEQFNF
jgi:hypothetical protein